MNRRNFLKNFSLATSGLGALPLFARATATNATEQFSFQLITNHVESALPALEALLQTALPTQTRVKYAEYPLAGAHLGDLVMVINNQLINYRTAPEPFAAAARDLVKTLGLPRAFENPVLLKFYNAAPAAKPEHANVFVNNVLVKQIRLHDETRTHEIAGLKGRMALALQHGSVKVAGTSCQHQTCMRLGAINEAGQHLVCIPNAVRISIEGQNENGVDGVTF